MYLGKIVEMGLVEQIFSKPLHPYSKALMSSVPIPNPKVKVERIELSGETPSPINLLKSCRLQQRCPFASARCSEGEPKLIEVEKGHLVACYLNE
jgi:peptide/nickel transport system ATP-binding protein/oligopeptide transport system ATP-binding protein